MMHYVAWIKPNSVTCGSGSVVSGSGLDPDSMVSLDPDTDPGGKKRPTKKEKSNKFSIFMYWLKASPVAWTSFMEV
jgi:hypothetical protein